MRSCIAFVFLFLLALMLSCAEDYERDNPHDPKGINYSELKSYCVYSEIRTCFSGSYSSCPGSGELSDFCPYISNSSSANSSQNGQSSSGVAVQEYDYCVFTSDKVCLAGHLSSCPPGGTLSNFCPYSSSSSSVVHSSSSVASIAPSSSSIVTLPSSSSVVPSSSSVLPSSSTVVPSSSSATVSSSSTALPSSSSVVPSSSSVLPSSSSSPMSDTSGTLTDARDGKVYKWVKIGEQYWMADNLNYRGTEPDTLGSCYKNDPDNCKKYGRLYNWATAMALDTSCNISSCSLQISEKHKGICPDGGWHIPSDADWNVLMQFVIPNCLNNNTCAGAGKKLKSKNDWYSNNGNGTDDYGFAALPGGLYDFLLTSFSSVGSDGVWWSATESSANIAYRRNMRYANDAVGYLNVYKNYLQSVRCVKD